MIQVNPKLLGDDATRFFAYWTVRIYTHLLIQIKVILFIDLSLLIT